MEKMPCVSCPLLEKVGLSFSFRMTCGSFWRRSLKARPSCLDICFHITLRYESKSHISTYLFLLYSTSQIMKTHYCRSFSGCIVWSPTKEGKCVLWWWVMYSKPERKYTSGSTWRYFRFATREKVYLLFFRDLHLEEQQVKMKRRRKQ